MRQVLIGSMVEKNPWWRNVSGPFPKWEGPIGCKADGGGCHYAQGKVGNKFVHTAVHNKDVAGRGKKRSLPDQARTCVSTV